MFNKLSLLALVAPLVSGLVLDQPTQPVESSASITITWRNEQADVNRFSTFNLYLNNEDFRDTFAIANNVDPSAGTITLTLPVLPARAGYKLQAVNIGNVGDVYAETGEFSVIANTDSTTSSASTTSRASSTASASSTSRSGSATSVLTTTRASSTSGFGSTVTSPAGSSSTGSSTGSSSAGSSAPAGTSNAAMSTLKSLNFNMGGIAAVLLSAVAGAAIVL